MTLPTRIALLMAPLVITLSACSEPSQAPAPAPQATTQAAPLPPQQTTGTLIDPAPKADATGLVPLDGAKASASPRARAIDTAIFPETPPAPSSRPAADPIGKILDADSTRNRLIRAQVLLDRARFSPGAIDGQGGSNLKLALSAYQAAKGLPVTGALDVATLNALIAGDSGPAMQDYQITAEDVAGPFTPKFDPSDYVAMAKLDRLNYATPREALAEKFHMDEALLAALNPGVDFTVAGTTILVAAPRATPLAPVAAIEVDKSLGEVRAYDAAHAILAVYPATVGSTERPAPTGEWAVRAVAPHPTFTYDPKRLTYGKPKSVLTIAAGPNNPVGAAWIDLTKDTFGIHGAPDPRLINKRASHGCVRLTNWDVLDLAGAVKKGVKVTFVGAETRAKT